MKRRRIRCEGQELGGPVDKDDPPAGAAASTPLRGPPPQQETEVRQGNTVPLGLMESKAKLGVVERAGEETNRESKSMQKWLQRGGKSGMKVRVERTNPKPIKPGLKGTGSEGLDRSGTEIPESKA